MLDFNDTKTAFILKTNRQLRKAHWLFRLVANSSLVSFGSWASNIALKIGLPIKGIVKQTVYDQFVGGETIEECQGIIDQLKAHGVSAVLDFAIEGKVSEDDFNKTRDEIIATIEYASQHEGLPFAVFKVTGIGKFAILEKYSAGQVFNQEEEAAWQRIKQRVEDICAKAHEKGLYIMIDAEETWIQKAIDDLATEMMERYNREGVVVINTFQMYRVDRLDFLKESKRHADEKAYHLGAKFVRGAYMEKERERAAELGYPDPIHPTKEGSDNCYNDGLAYLSEHLNSSLIVAGSHNEESCRLLADLLDKKAIERKDQRVWFSQLYGMSDNLSFNLAKEGYNVVKYLPFGPVNETLPYLIRRAEENSSAGGQSNRELGLIEKEMQRRGMR